MIDKTRRQVSVSKNFPLESQRFTSAHELGHALLHKELVLHRGRSIDGTANSPRSAQELQADKFATFFLMPGRVVRATFVEIFNTDRFRTNASNPLALRAGSAFLLGVRYRDVHGLALYLASVEYFAGKNFNSLSKVFGVSVKIMAIRLEELNLVFF